MRCGGLCGIGRADGSRFEIQLEAYNYGDTSIAALFFRYLSSCFPFLFTFYFFFVGACCLCFAFWCALQLLPTLKLPSMVVLSFVSKVGARLRLLTFLLSSDPPMFLVRFLMLYLAISIVIRHSYS